MALAAVRDFKRYKQEYMAQGMSETEANAKAAARAGVTLGANLKGGPLASIVNAANAYDNAVKSGQGEGEALATTIGTVGGGLIANKVAPTGPVGDRGLVMLAIGRSGVLLARVRGGLSVPAIQKRNMKDALDLAFLCRLRFVVQFPFREIAHSVHKGAGKIQACAQGKPSATGEQISHDVNGGRGK